MQIGRANKKDENGIREEGKKKMRYERDKSKT
jgi:hypothetical protein